MWKALRTDLTEFVNTVTGDTADALNQIDASFPENDGTDDQPSAAEQEALRRMALEETYTTPLIPEKEEGAAAAEKSDDDDKEQEDDDDDAKEKAESTDDEADEEYNEEEEVSEDVKEFVASFSIDTKTDEVALLLDLHPNLKAHFEKLVPTTVKYDEFWMRYFYRCDAERIQAEWDVEEEAAKAARAQAVQQGLSTVRNFLGGAVKTVSSALGEEDTGGEAHAGSGLKMTSNQAAKVASGYFGSAGRPPFVMNTAVSEDDYDGEEEEELGWDDDEDEDFEQNEEANEESVDTEQIEFNDAVTEKLQEDLKQALSERDSLQQTVELQHKEIAALKKEGASNDEMEKLKTQLFEKDSEIAAMRASILDSSRTEEGGGEDPKLSALEAEVKRLTTKLNEAEASAKDSMEKLEKAQTQLEQIAAEGETSKNAVESANTKNQELVKEVVDLKKKVSNLETDNANFQEALKAARAKAAEGKSSHAEMSTLQAELEKVKASLATSEQRKEELESELQKTKESLRLKEESSKVEEEAKSIDSPDTVSTGIKIEAPAIEKLDEEAAVEDGWGDDDW